MVSGEPAHAEPPDLPALLTLCPMLLMQLTTDNGQDVGWALPTTKLTNDKLALEF